MKKITASLLVAASLALSGCASTVLESKPFKTYSIGVPVTASVGMPFLTAQTGTIKKVKTWVGLAYSPDGWRVDDIYSPDFVKKELIYSGKTGSTIEIGYREFRYGLAAPAFYQSVKYDLSESSTVTFQNFQIQIHSAGNSSITATILRD